MQEKVIEIIVHILNEIKNSKTISDIDVADLTSSGYTDAEINTAFAWIFSKLESGENIFKNDESNSNSHRFFHPAEMKVITPESRGYLIQMKELGLISGLDEEIIIDRIMMSGYQNVGIKEVKNLISSLVFDLESGRPQSLPNLVFQNNETIH